MTLDKTIAFRYLTMFALGSLLSAQVNTEALRKGDLSPGLHTAFEIDVGVVAGNSNLLNINTTLRFDYLKGATHTFLVGSRQLSSQGEDDTLFINKGFVHLRRTKSISGLFYIEGFVQKEFNQFIHLEDRNLIGGGLRIRWPEIKPGKEGTSVIKLFTGLGFMWEQERIRDAKDPDDSLQNLLRSTNYIVLGWEPDQRLLFQSTVYFQPAVRHLNDFRVLFDGGFSFTLTNRLTVAIKSYVRYDHDPPAGLNLKKYDLELTNKLVYMF